MDEYIAIVRHLFGTPVQGKAAEEALLLLQGIESQVSAKIEPVLYDSEVSKKMKRVLSIFTDELSVNTVGDEFESCDCDLHDIAADLVCSGQRGHI